MFNYVVILVYPNGVMEDIELQANSNRLAIMSALEHADSNVQNAFITVKEEV